MTQLLTPDMRGESRVAVRDAFESGGRGLAEIMDQIAAGEWNQPGLGVWSIRDLVGHASRSLITVEDYLGQQRVAVSSPELGPVDYYLAIRESLADADGVAQRGRDAGAALGDDPAAAVRVLLDRVTALVAGSADDAPVATPVGSMTLLGYLPTRTFELAVHSLDLTRALGVEPPPVLGLAVSASCELAGQIAGRLPRAADLLLSMTGRADQVEGLSVV